MTRVIMIMPYGAKLFSTADMIAFQSTTDHPRRGYSDRLFLFMWPSPWSDDLHMRILPRYCEAVPAYQTGNVRGGQSVSTVYNITDRQTDRQTHRQTDDATENTTTPHLWVANIYSDILSQHWISISKNWHRNVAVEDNYVGSYQAIPAEL